MTVDELLNITDDHLFAARKDIEELRRYVDSRPLPVPLVNEIQRRMEAATVTFSLALHDAGSLETI